MTPLVPLLQFHIGPFISDYTAHACKHKKPKKYHGITILLWSTMYCKYSNT